MHIPQAIAAFDHGCHVLCEKPLADTTDDLASLIAKRDATGLKMMVALCFRHHAGHLYAKSLLDAGRIGRLVSIRAIMGEHLPDVRPDYREMYMSKTTGAWDLMHDLDLAIWYANQPVTRVSALSGSISDINIQADDTVEILLQFQNRCIGSVHMDFFQRPRHRQLELIGSEGTITIEFARWEHCTVSMWSQSEAQWQTREFEMIRDDMYRAEDEAFLKAVTEDAPITCTVEESSKSVDIILAAQKDAKKQTP
jgi:predicted dehydrogenase